jgi:hypothetical protein
MLGALIISNCPPAFLPVCFPLLLQVCLLSLVWVSTSLFSYWLLVISFEVRSSTNLQLRFSPGKCAPRCILPALPMRWLLAVRVVFDSVTVIPLLYVEAPPTTNPLRLLRVPYRLFRLDSKVDFQQQLCISRLSRLSRDRRDWVGISSGTITWACGVLIHLLVSLPSLLWVHFSWFSEYNWCFFSMCTWRC